jgi:hypothetical protein
VGRAQSSRATGCVRARSSVDDGLFSGNMWRRWHDKMLAESPARPRRTREVWIERSILRMSYSVDFG